VRENSEWCDDMVIFLIAVREKLKGLLVILGCIEGGSNFFFSGQEEGMH
jgi:hypothetical protein